MKSSCINMLQDKSNQKKEELNKHRSVNNDFIFIESDEHRYLLALYHAIYKEEQDASIENIRAKTRALKACNAFYMG